LCMFMWSDLILVSFDRTADPFHRLGMCFHFAVKIANRRGKGARLADGPFVNGPDACKGLILQDAHPIFGHAVRKRLAWVERKQALNNAENLHGLTQ